MLRLVKKDGTIIEIKGLNQRHTLLIIDILQKILSSLGVAEEVLKNIAAHIDDAQGCMTIKRCQWLNRNQKSLGLEQAIDTQINQVLTSFVPSEYLQQNGIALPPSQSASNIQQLQNPAQSNSRFELLCKALITNLTTAQYGSNGDQVGADIIDALLRYLTGAEKDLKTITRFVPLGDEIVDLRSFIESISTHTDYKKALLSSLNAQIPKINTKSNIKDVTIQDIVSVNIFVNKILASCDEETLKIISNKIKTGATLDIKLPVAKSQVLNNLSRQSDSDEDSSGTATIKKKGPEIIIQENKTIEEQIGSFDRNLVMTLFAAHLVSEASNRKK